MKKAVVLGLIAILGVVYAPTVMRAQTNPLSLSMTAKNVSKSGSFSKNPVVAAGEKVGVQVNLTASSVVETAQVTINMPQNVAYVQGSAKVNNATFSGVNFVSSNLGGYGTFTLGNMNSGDSKQIYFEITPTVLGSQALGAVPLKAEASAKNVLPISDTISLNGTGVTDPVVGTGTAGVTSHISGVNETKNVAASSVPASREDFLTFTLTATNNGSAPVSGYVMSADLSQVMAYADMVDNGGGTLIGNSLSFPATSIPAGSTVSKSFKVRVKYQLGETLAYTLSVNFGGSSYKVQINKSQVQGAFVAPKTGAETNALLFALLMTGAFAAARYRKQLVAFVR